jgi:hypothetical protein
LYVTLEDIMVVGGPFFGDLHWRLASWPINVGGLSLYSAVAAASYVFLASRGQYWVLQNHILRDSGICSMDSNFDIALDGLFKRFLCFIWAVLLRKILFLLKPNIFWRMFCLLKLFRTWKLSLIWPQDRKQYLGVCKHHMFKIFFLLFPLMD